MNSVNNFSCKKHPNLPLTNDFKSGDLICPCGRVVGNKVVYVEESPFFQDDQEKNESFISTSTRRVIKRDAKILSKKPGKTPRRIRPSKKERLAAILEDVERISDGLRLYKCITDLAKSLAQKVHESTLDVVVQDSELAPACVYIACRLERVPRTAMEISFLCEDTSKQAITTLAQSITGAMGLPSAYTKETSVDYTSRFSSILDLTMHTQKLAACITAKAFDLFSGHQQLSIVGAALLMASKHLNLKPKTAKEIGALVGMGEATLKHLAKKMEAQAHVLFS